MRLTVAEQSSLAVGPRADEATSCLATAQALSVIDLGERMGARIAAWQGPASLRLQQFVGVVRTGDLQLEILPKLDALPEPADVRRSLLAMLAGTQDLAVRASDLVRFLESSEPFVNALARLYCDRLLAAVRRGLGQEYVQHEDLLPYVRGNRPLGAWSSPALSTNARRTPRSTGPSRRPSSRPARCWRGAGLPRW